MKSNLYFKRDLYAVENDRNLRHLCRMYPVWGEAVFFSAVCMMYRVDGKDYDFEDLALDVTDALYTDNQEKVTEILSECVHSGLFKMKGKKIWSDRVKCTCKEQILFRERQSEKGKKSAEKRLRNKSLSDKEIGNSGSASVQQRFNTGSTYNQDQDQDQDQDQNQDNNTSYSSKSADSDAPDSEAKEDFSLSAEEDKATASSNPIPYRKIVDYWNQTVGDLLPKVRDITDSRKRVIAKKWKQYGEDDIYKAIDMVKASDFMTRNKSNWCNFDWVFKANNMQKVLEGNYANKRAEDIAPAKHRDYSDIGVQDDSEFDWGV